MEFKELKNGKSNLCINGRVVGTIQIVDLSQAGAYIKYLNVKSRQRRRGYGRALINFAIEKAKKNTCEGVSLYVETINDNAVAFYRHLGFFIAMITAPKDKIKAHYLMVKQI